VVVTVALPFSGELRPEVAQRAVDRCPCPRCAVIIAFSCFTGLRCPSEIVELRWGDINPTKGKSAA
jgi:integrase